MTKVLRTLFGLAVGSLAARLFALLGRFNGNGVAKKTSRRTFTRNSALGAAGIVLAELTGGFVYFFWPNKTGAFGGEINVAPSQVPDVGGTPYRDVEGKFYVVHNEDGVLALYWKCVHLGCTVPWIEGEKAFHCPCHGSIYDYNGVRVAGPAPRPLDIMAVSVGGDGGLTVNTGEISTRSGYDPSQAVPYNA